MACLGVANEEPIVNAGLKLLGQHLSLHVPPAYECSCFALIAHFSS
jgi:hypothetical protein